MGGSRGGGEGGGRLKVHKNPVKRIKWFIQPIVEK
jgi:hypothetical protein